MNKPCENCDKAYELDGEVLEAFKDWTRASRKTRFGIEVQRHHKGMWSFGICLSHWDDETYIYINLFKVSLSIGRLYVGTPMKGE